MKSQADGNTYPIAYPPLKVPKEMVAVALWVSVSDAVNGGLGVVVPGTQAWDAMNLYNQVESDHPGTNIISEYGGRIPADKRKNLESWKR